MKENKEWTFKEKAQIAKNLYDSICDMNLELDEIVEDTVKEILEKQDNKSIDFEPEQKIEIGYCENLYYLNKLMIEDFKTTVKLVYKDNTRFVDFNLLDIYYQIKILQAAANLIEK